MNKQAKLLFCWDEGSNSTKKQPQKRPQIDLISVCVAATKFDAVAHCHHHRPPNIMIWPPAASKSRIMMSSSPCLPNCPQKITKSTAKVDHQNRCRCNSSTAAILPPPCHFVPRIMTTILTSIWTQKLCPKRLHPELLEWSSRRTAAAAMLLPRHHAAPQSPPKKSRETRDRDAMLDPMPNLPMLPKIQCCPTKLPLSTHYFFQPRYMYA